MIWTEHEVSIVSAEDTVAMAGRALRIEGYVRSLTSISHKLQEIRRVENGLPRGVFTPTKEE